MCVPFCTLIGKVALNKTEIVENTVIFVVGVSVVVVAEGVTVVGGEVDISVGRAVGVAVKGVEVGKLVVGGEEGDSVLDVGETLPMDGVAVDGA